MSIFTRHLVALFCVNAFFLVFSCQRMQPSGQLQIEFRPTSNDMNAGTVEVVGLDKTVLSGLRSKNLSVEKWQELMPVFVGDAYPQNVENRPPILGRYRVGEETIIFEPRFSFRQDLTHYARLDVTRLYSHLGQQNPTGQQIVESSHLGKTVVTIPTTTVTQVYPSADEVPGNLLRLYVHFSAPMSQRAVNDYIHLYDFNGIEVPLPFVEIEEGLWDRNHQRLTLFFHPGRIKRGVGPNLAMGSPLQAGQTYHLVVDQKWHDASGNPLVKGFQKTFSVTPADRQAVDHKAWQIQPPRAETVQPIVLGFPEPLDHALLLRMLTVNDMEGRYVEGDAVVTHDETRWTWTPKRSWRTGQYKILVETRLEDLAGNNLRGVFDRDIQSESDKAAGEFVEIPFEVKATNRT